MRQLKPLSVLITWLTFLILQPNLSKAETFELLSPDQRIQVKIEIGSNITYSVIYDSQTIIESSPISMKVNDGMILGHNPVLLNIETSSVDQNIYPVIAEKRAVVVDNYNEIRFTMLSFFGLTFRAYNDGVAYRFNTTFPVPTIIINSEEASFKFADDYSTYVSFSTPLDYIFQTSFEGNYHNIPLSMVGPKRKVLTPALVNVPNGPKILITEANLEDYPGMFLTGVPDDEQYLPAELDINALLSIENPYLTTPPDEPGPPHLYGSYARYPAFEFLYGDRYYLVGYRAPFLAFTEGTRNFPWRVMLIADNDSRLIDSDIVYRLAKPLALNNTSWIKPGKVAWDWWTANYLDDVDFTPGVNTQTYLRYIDFASANDIEYINLDEGWSDTTNLFAINSDIDMPTILNYAKQKGVGVWLWMLWTTLDSQLEPALDMFADWGIAGIKVDFLNRDDQKAVQFVHKIAQETASRELMVNFHGVYKPTGLRRSYPNVITREAVQGLEHNKYAPVVTPEHDVTIPFIRMVTGPMDFTPGAMVNAQPAEYMINWERPMSQGTRTHQLAMYVVYESPLQMLADSPSYYNREPEVMSWLSKVPTVWDETKILAAELADYLVVARKSDDEWYIGAINDSTPRTIKISLDFLEDSQPYKAEIWSDSKHSNFNGMEFEYECTRVSRSDGVKIKLASGGGWTARIFKRGPDCNGLIPKY